MVPSYSRSDSHLILTDLQSSLTQAPRQRERITNTETNNSIHPAHLSERLVIKAVRLVIRQSSFITNVPLEYISSLPVRPGIAHESTVLARWNISGELLRLRR